MINKTLTAIGIGALLLMNTPAQSQTLQPPSPYKSSRIISIEGQIDEQLAYIVTKQIKEFDNESHEEIEVDISTYGGDVYAGLKIIDAMQSAHSPIKTVCEGYCMSMGAFILASGSPGDRFSMPHATILIHQVSSEAKGTLTEMKNDMVEMERLQNVVLDILEKATGLSEDRLTTLCDHDNFMTPQTAKSLHIIDGILK